MESHNDIKIKYTNNINDNDAHMKTDRGLKMKMVAGPRPWLQTWTLSAAAVAGSVSDKM